MWVDPESAYEQVEEELYEVQEKDAAVDDWFFLHWTDFEGNLSVASETLECPPGWTWADSWRVDLNCPGDEEGFTYQTDNLFQFGFEYAERIYHRFRRRRWVRKRLFKGTEGEKERAEMARKTSAEFGWEYAVQFGKPTHLRIHPEDKFRRRRLHNQMIPAKSLNKGDTRLFTKLAVRVRELQEVSSG